MHAFAVRRPLAVLCVAGLLALAAAVGLFRLRQEDDLLVFLPSQDPDVKLFRKTSERFGALRVALVGVLAPDGREVFDPEVLGKINQASRALRDVRGVDRVVSLTTLTDVVSGAVGAEVRPLVQGLPRTAADAEALRARVMSREHVVGSFVSADGRAALIMVFLASGLGDREVVRALRQTAQAELHPLRLFLGGAPFAGRAIYEEAQADIWRLSPLALLLLLLVVMLAFSDPVAVLLTVLSVAYAILLVLGGMGLFGEHFTVASSTLPVILFASGNAYAVHVLGRYYLIRRELGPPEVKLPRPEVAGAVDRALRVVGAPVAIAALTTSIGFFSFVITDVRPMRAFGIACGIGVLLCWVTSQTLIPALLVLFPRQGSSSVQLARLGRWLVGLAELARRHRAPVLILSVLCLAVTIRPMLKVRVRMEPRTFFRPGSEPWQALRFLEERFGGAVFVQVGIDGDLDQPVVLRELARLEDFARSLPAVTQVTSIVEPLRLVSEVMGGGKRLPDTPAQAKNLYFFLEGEAGMRSLIAEGRRQALVHVRVRGDAAEVVRALEEYVAHQLRTRPRGPGPGEVDAGAEIAERVQWVARALHRPVPTTELIAKAVRNAQGAVPKPGGAAAAEAGAEARTSPPPAALRSALGAVLKTEEAQVLKAEARAELVRIADAPDADLETLRTALRRLATQPDDGDLLFGALEERIAQERRAGLSGRVMAAALAAAGFNDVDSRTRARLSQAVDEILAAARPGDGAPGGPPAAEAAAAGAGALGAQVSGEPILDRGFSRSVGDAQLRSLVLALVLVFGALFALFRSVRTSFVALYPAVLTLALVSGVMGAWGRSIDLGTSLVAGIATGAGSDFAMHYLWYLRRDSLEEVSRTVGPINVVSILLVSLGFWVLALGKSPVMNLFGNLTCASMALSALFTLLLVPALLNKVERSQG